MPSFPPYHQLKRRSVSPLPRASREPTALAAGTGSVSPLPRASRGRGVGGEGAYRQQLHLSQKRHPPIIHPHSHPIIDLTHEINASQLRIQFPLDRFRGTDHPHAVTFGDHAIHLHLSPRLLSRRLTRPAVQIPHGTATTPHLHLPAAIRTDDPVGRAAPVIHARRATGILARDPACILAQLHVTVQPLVAGKERTRQRSIRRGTSTAPTSSNLSPSDSPEGRKI